MTDKHPIIPPPELVDQWYNKCHKQHEPFTLYMTTQAAQWGADQELEACVEWLQDPDLNVDTYKLRAARRPKPPSLKEQAKFAAAVLRSPDETCSIAELQQHWHTICKALEALPND